MGIFDQTVAELGHAFRLVCPPMQTGVGTVRDINMRTLNAAGVRLTGRFRDADGFTVRLGDDLQSNASRSDEAAIRFRAGVDDYVREGGIDAPVETDFEPTSALPDAPTELDLRALGINNVIWATGFRLDFSWIDLDLETVDGYPAQTQGVSRHPGLYFMGLQLMHTRKSGLIFGVGEDAAHVSSAIAYQLGVS